MLRIGIDYTIAVTGIAGLTRHTRALMAALLEIDRANEYILIVTSDAKGDVVSTLPRKVAIRKLPFSELTARMIWHRISLPLPLELFTGQLDVFHSPNFVLPYLRHAQGIVTIHDLAYMVYPQYANLNVKSFDIRRHTWGNTAQETLKLYEKVCRS
jgi:glycosyltransferase involved in cell wall biosynthesis